MIKKVPSDSDFNLIEIDKINLYCYENIAFEYDSELHQTCRDFDEAGKVGLKSLSKLECFQNLSSFKYLDIGVGTGSSLEVLLPWLSKSNAHITVLDISPKMIDVCKKKFDSKIHRYEISSIFDFDSKGKFDLIVSTLCDPFLTTQFLKKVRNLLSHDGVLFLTLPTRTWAEKIRKDSLDSTKTIFHNKDRHQFEGYSFCWSKSVLIAYMEQQGFYVYDTKVITIGLVEKKKNTLSKLNMQLGAMNPREPLLLNIIASTQKEPH